MAIEERQLETWANHPSSKQFTDTYQSIRANLLDPAAPYPVKNVQVFLQGSYGNDTNVYGDSDVDIVLQHTGAFYYDSSRLTPKDLEAFKTIYPKDADYGYPQFKQHAEAWITRLYNDTRLGQKAVFVPGNNGRRNADILVCESFRRYNSTYDSYHNGVAFFSGGKRIENFPKQHSDNLTAKHQATNNNFKRMVRVFKNMRNSMIEKKLLAEGIAPSYFIEGMLWNVPNDRFFGNYREMWAACFNWVNSNDPSNLTTGSGMHWLVRDNENVCWPSANFQTFTAALKKYWEM
ncbi:nucleotidyltransferase [Bradyrhizobium sp. BRP20]|uniref:nucleotidyltransferase domain-containing protein n=2 Tax=Bradyrhizobium TaxID=374 RepID=UPI001CD789B2|nr:MULTISPECIES: nucleotidyltransferase [unclassified Bradyrhizobium]MCA1434679.1 nucleotidyltransferase [Bradyrhizobium sp. BRP20]MCA1549759.1 nucleotidyltransferase [Bradyrhizobium sp. BRP19]